MKKLIAISLILICVMGLSSCSSSTLKNKWFSNEILEKCAVPDLPEISGRDYYRTSDESADVWDFNYIEFKATSEEVRDYARAVYEYLAAQNFEYLGTRGYIKTSLAGAFTTYYFKDTSSFGECYSPYYAEEYIFVYSNDKDTSDGIIFNEILITSVDSKTIKYDGKDVTVNAEINIKYDVHYALKDSEITYPIEELVLGYWFFHSGIIDGKEVIMYDKEENGLLVTPTYYSLMIFNDDYTGEYEFKGNRKAFAWTKLDETNIKIKFSDDDSVGTVTFINDERIRFAYDDLIIIYDE